MKTSEVLRKAAHVVLERGLARYTREDSKGRVCLLGAIGVAGYGSPEPDRIWDVAEGKFPAMGIFREDGSYPAVAWSNQFAESEEDVASLLYSEAEVCDE